LWQFRISSDLKQKVSIQSNKMFLRSEVVDDPCWHARIGICSEVKRDKQEKATGTGYVRVKLNWNCEASAKTD
jgi:hypothetical protein